MGGLSAASFLGRAGRRVLLVERNEKFGGFGAAFQRGPYTFDPAIHSIAQGENFLFAKALRYLEVFDQIEFINTGSFFDVHMPDLRLHLPQGPDEYTAFLGAAFPGEEENVRRFVALCAQVHREIHSIPPHLTLRELEQAVAQYPTMFKYRMSTLAEVLDEHFADERLKAVIGAWWPYFGVPPSQLSFFTVTTPMTSFLREGQFHCAGGTQSLVDAIVSAVGKWGGEMIAGNGARRILLSDGRVSGVELDDGTVVKAPVVVAAGDARRTFEELVGLDALPTGYVRKFQRLRPSVSAVVIYAATSLDVRALGLGHTTFMHRHWSHDRVYADLLAGRPGGLWLAIPTLVDETLAPPGEHLLIWTCLAPTDAVMEAGEREAYVDEVIGMHEPLLPGLRESLTHLESATPRTLARYGGSQNGEIYGWENTPQQAGTNRLAHRTPVEGLFLCGHWTRPGSSSFRSFFSGVEATMAILGGGFADQFLRGLELAPSN